MIEAARVDNCPGRIDRGLNSSDERLDAAMLRCGGRGKAPFPDPPLCDGEGLPITMWA